MASLNSRFYALDMLKGIAILAVVLYHLGVMKYGYLGVDVFLVVAGYLTTRTWENHKPNYGTFLLSRLTRLWPLAILATIASLVGGYFCLLPQQFKNTSETALGTLVFMNNVVQCITSSDYWNPSNDFKPLMHTWYIALLMQFYVIFPFIFIIAKYKKRTVIFLITLVGTISLAMFLFPVMGKAQNFFYLPARLFEFCAGAGLYYWQQNNNNIEKTQKSVFMIILLLLITIIAIGFDITIGSMRLLLTVTLSILLINIATRLRDGVEILPILKPVTTLGISSYSIFIWHQVIIAFYRNIVTSRITPPNYGFILLLILCLLIGILSYRLMEQPLNNWGSIKKRRLIVIACCSVSTFSISIPAYKFYQQKGIVRDVPELAINKERGEEVFKYNGRIDAMDKPFPNNKKTNVLVVGDSYARDWTNVLIEAGVDSIANISYHREVDDELYKRLKQAASIFLVTCTPAFDQYSHALPKMMECPNFWRVGVKHFGNDINSIWFKQSQWKPTDKYSVIIDKYWLDLNEDEQYAFAPRYINLLEAMRQSDGSIPAFVPNTNLLISYDGLHLSKAGACYLSHIIHPLQFIPLN